MLNNFFMGNPIPDKNRPRKVVFYGRVSTEHEAQLSALENQMQWYEDTAKRYPNWEVVGRYIDEGITGTQAKKRPSFMRMIADAEKGMFDLIVTREVCRFARNTVDTLTHTRALKGRGIEVFFVDDNIWTMDGDGELRLTIMATLAQEESRKVSERVKAGQRISRANKQLFGSGNILGYDRKPGETYTINPEQAETVRMIYDLYEEGYGTLKIAKILMERKRLTATGTTKWTCHNVGRILQNATYKGYIGYNKSYSNNYLEQKRIHNLDKDSYVYVKGDFEPIITEEQWDKCQAILKEKRKTTLVENGEEKKKSNRTSSDVWVKKLRCSCGSSFRKNRYHKHNDGTTTYNYVCYNQVNNGKASQRVKMGLEADGYCDEHSVTDWKMEMMAKYFLNEAWKSRKEDLMIALEYIKKYYTDATRNNTQHSELFLDAQIDKAEKKLKNLVDLFTDGQISKEEFAEFKATYSADLQKFKDEKARCGEQQELFENCMCDMTAVSQALAGMVDMSSPEYTHDLMNEIVNSILVKDNRFIWNFSYNKTENTDMNISIEGNKRKKQCPVITIDGEIMGTPSGVPDFSVLGNTAGIPSGVPDFLHISGNNSLDLPAEIRNNPLFAKKASLLLHLHRLHCAKVVNHKFALVWDFKITYEMAKNWRKAHNAYLRQNQWKDLTVKVCLDVG